MGAGIICILIGIFILFIFGVFKRVPNQKKVKGIIYSNEFSHFDREPDGGGKNLYNFYVQYYVNGKEYIIKSKHTSQFKKEGKKITVKYNSKKPEEAIIVDDSIFIVSLIFIVFGIYAIIYSIIN